GAKFKSLLVWGKLREGKKAFVRPEPATSLTSEIQKHRLSLQAERFLPTVPVDFPQGSYRPQQGVGYGPYVMLELFQAVERDIRFARAAWPGRPLFVVQTDLREFYPSLAHNLVREVMGQLGVPARWLDFFDKFLKPRVRYRGEVRSI